MMECWSNGVMGGANYLQHSSTPIVKSRIYRGGTEIMLFNKERLLNLMDRHDLAGVVAATAENIFYLSGHASWSQNGYRYGGSQVYVVYPRDPAQSPALLIPSGDAAYATLDEGWLKEAYIYGSPRKPIVPDPSKLGKEEIRTLEITESAPKGATPEKALAQLIKDKGMDRGRIGMDHFGIPLTIYQKIGSYLPDAKLLPASMFFRYVRMIKTPEEIQRLRESAALFFFARYGIHRELHSFPTRRSLPPPW